MQHRNMIADEHGSTVADTRSLAGARDHARSLAGDTPETVDVPDDAPGAVGAKIVWSETLDGGGYSSRRVLRGTVVRFEDLQGDACLQLLVHNAQQPAERLNVADTVKVQWQAYLGEGALLLSDMGRAMMTIIADTSARHDCLCGCSSRRTNSDRYGEGVVSGRHPSGRDLLALGLAKFGLSKRDVAPNINLFKSVRVDDGGALALDGDARPGTHVHLRAEMDLIVTVANTPHPLDERVDYTVTPVRCLAWQPVDAFGDAGRDVFRSATPERSRAFENTDDYLLGVRP